MEAGSILFALGSLQNSFRTTRTLSRFSRCVRDAALVHKWGDRAHAREWWTSVWTQVLCCVIFNTPHYSESLIGVRLSISLADRGLKRKKACPFKFPQGTDYSLVHYTFSSLIAIILLNFSKKRCTKLPRKMGFTFHFDSGLLGSALIPTAWVSAPCLLPYDNVLLVLAPSIQGVTKSDCL